MSRIVKGLGWMDEWMRQVAEEGKTFLFHVSQNGNLSQGSEKARANEERPDNQGSLTRRGPAHDGCHRSQVRLSAGSGY